MTGEIVATAIVITGIVLYLADTYFHLGIFDKLSRL